MANGIGTFKPAGDKPPKADRAPKGRPSAAQRTSARRTTLRSDRPFKATLPDIREALDNALGMMILGFSMKGDMHCATILEQSGPEMLDSWIWLAEKRPEVRRALEVLTGGSGYAALVTSTLAVALPMMQHHKMYPANAPIPGSINPMNLFKMEGSEGAEGIDTDAN